MVTPSALQTQLARGALDPAYLILGDDEHEKAELVTELEQVVDEELRAFNVDRFHGGDTSLGRILDAARTLPMVAPRRLVVTTGAERVLEPARETETTARESEALVAFLKAAPSHVTLVFVAGRLDERRKLTKRLLSHATVVRCGVLETVADAQRWIRARVKTAGLRMTPDAVRSLAERAGPDIVRLRDDLERLFLYVGDRPEISADDVAAVTRAAVGHDTWAVTRAVEQGDAATALRELGLTLAGGAVPYVVLGQLAWIARSRVPTGRRRAAIDSVFRTDLAIKRSSGDPRVLLERLVIDLCGAGRVSSGSGRG